MEYKKRDRTGETYFDWTVVGPGKESKTWVMKCKCGREKTVPATRMNASKTCKSCSAKAKNKNLGKFLASVNDLAPRKPKIKPDTLYEFEYYQCLYPVFGRLVSEYQKAACFEIVDCHKSDKSLLRNLGNRVVVTKKEVTEICN